MRSQHKREKSRTARTSTAMLLNDATSKRRSASSRMCASASSASVHAHATERVQSSTVSQERAPRRASADRHFFRVQRA